MGGHHHYGSKHDHCDSEHFDKFRLKVVLVINIIVATCEIVTGFVYSNSFSLAGDGVHMLTHIPVIFLTLCLYGKKSSENISSLITGCFILFMGCYIAYNAGRRFYNPQEIQETAMIVVAVIGLLTNIFQVWMLQPTNRSKRNMRDIFRHLVGDTAYSVCVVCGGISMVYTKWYIVDSMISCLILPVIFSWGYRSVKDALIHLKD